MIAITHTKKGINKRAVCPFITMTVAFLMSLTKLLALVFKSYNSKSKHGLQKINKNIFFDPLKYYFKNKFHRFDSG